MCVHVSQSVRANIVCVWVNVSAGVGKRQTDERVRATNRVLHESQKWHRPSTRTDKSSFFGFFSKSYIFSSFSGKNVAMNEVFVEGRLGFDFSRVRGEFLCNIFS